MLKMSKKGFTLIELLSVIIILAVILVIAVPKILKIIDNVKIEAFKKSETSMVNAAKLYMTNNINSLPIDEGSSTEVTLAELQQQGLLKTINSPEDKSKECKGYIVITKVKDNEYDYIPHLNCINNINTSIEDALIGHYTFDDYQEPTINIAPNPIGVGGTSYANYTINAELNNITAPDGSLTASKLTATANGQIRTEFSVASPAVDTYYTFSIFTKRGSSPYAAIGTYFYPYASPAIIANLDTGTIVFSVSTTSSSITREADGWWHISMTVLIKPDQIYRLFKILQTTSATDVSVGNTGGYIYYWGAQLEKKTYSTPFTLNTRSGTVKDYSASNNYATLQTTNTPTWVEDSKIGKGAYKFNGISNVISTNSFSFGSNLSICFWTKPYISSIKEMVMHGDYSNGAFEFYQNNTAISLRGGGTSTVTGNNALTINTWNFVCGTINGTVGKVYSNGELLNTGAVQVPRTDSRPLNIGAYSDLQYSYNGLIDEISVYNRTLSPEEIKNIYNIEK